MERKEELDESFKKILDKYIYPGRDEDTCQEDILNCMKAAYGFAEERYKKESNWIKCSERMPDYDESVLWCRKDGLMFITALDKDGNPFLEDGMTTYWMLLPEPPKD